VCIVSFKGALTLVDPETLKVVRTFPLPTNVSRVAFSPDGAKAFLCFSNGDHILVLDLPTGEVRSITGNIGWNSSEILMDREGRSLYLATSGGTPPMNKILTIDPKSEHVTQEIDIGPYRFPEGFLGLQIDPKRSRAYAVDATARELVVIDLAAGKVARRVPLTAGIAYAGLAMSPDGSALYAGNWGNEAGGLCQIALDTLEPRTVGSIQGGTAIPVVSPDGKTVYTVLNQTHLIAVALPGGNERFNVDLVDRVDSLRCLAVSPSGDTLYVGSLKNKMLALDASSGAVRGQIDVNSPTDIVIVPAGDNAK
jgi:DNA-binding beta-propeller fold protein YncE